jgi:hypothetical protein
MDFIRNQADFIRNIDAEHIQLIEENINKILLGDLQRNQNFELNIFRSDLKIDAFHGNCTIKNDEVKCTCLNGKRHGLI